MGKTLGIVDLTFNPWHNMILRRLSRFMSSIQKTVIQGKQLKLLEFLHRRSFEVYIYIYTSLYKLQNNTLDVQSLPNRFLR